MELVAGRRRASPRLKTGLVSEARATAKAEAGGLSFTSGEEEEFTSGVAGFEVAVGLSGFSKRISVLDAELEGTDSNALEYVVGAGEEIGAGGDVILKRGTGDVEGAESGETDEIEGRNWTARSSEENERAAWPEAGEGLIEGGFADRVVDDGQAATCGEALYFGSEIGLGIEDDMMGAGGV